MQCVCVFKCMERHRRLVSSLHTYSRSDIYLLIFFHEVTFRNINSNARSLFELDLKVERTKISLDLTCKKNCLAACSNKFMMWRWDFLVPHVPLKNNVLDIKKVKFYYSSVSTRLSDMSFSFIFYRCVSGIQHQDRS